MSAVTPNRTPWIITGILVLLNLVLIGYILIGPPPPPEEGPTRGRGERGRQERLMSILDEKLNLSDDQQETFRNAWGEFHQNNQQDQRELMDLRKQFHEELLKENRNEAALDSLSATMCRVLNHRETLLREHVDFLMDQVTPDQQDSLRAVFNRMFRGPGRDDMPGPPGGRMNPGHHPH